MEYLVKRKNVLNLIFALTIFGLTLVMSACSAEPATSTVTATLPTPDLSVTGEALGTPIAAGDGSIASDVSQAVTERTPVPTPTPDLVTEIVDEIVSQSRFAGEDRFGMTTDDWINLGISALFFVVSYFLVVRLLFHLLDRLVKRTETKFDDDFLDTIGLELKSLVMVLLLRYAVLRLDFWDDELRTILGDLFFILSLGIFYVIVLHLIDFAMTRYRDDNVREEDRKRFDPILVMIKRLGYVFVSIIFLSFALSHFGIDISVLSAAIIFAALVVAIGARAAIADAVSGFIILADQPFRVGDAILIKELDTRGDVLVIGSRSTRVRTLNNREVIVPNSQICDSQVVNYAYPDPSLRQEAHINVAYGTDIDRIQQIFQETVRGVECVLPDRPVDVYFLTFGDSVRRIRVTWWIDSYTLEYIMLDRVNRALEDAFNKAGIEIPFPKYDLNLKMEGENSSRENSDLVGRES